MILWVKEHDIAHSHISPLLSQICKCSMFNYVQLPSQGSGAISVGNLLFASGCFLNVSHVSYSLVVTMKILNVKYVRPS